MSYELPQFVKNYLDELTDEQRDRVIEAPVLFPGATWMGFFRGHLCGCLVTTAHGNIEGCFLPGRIMTQEETNEYVDVVSDKATNLSFAVGFWFPYACTIAGYETVVAAIKSYLSRTNPKIEAVVSQDAVTV